MVPPLMWSTKVQKCLVVVVGGANLEADSIGLFTTLTESMKLKIDDMGADHLPVYFDL